MGVCMCVCLSLKLKNYICVRIMHVCASARVYAYMCECIYCLVHVMRILNR